MTDANKRMLVFVGSYAEASSSGLYVYEFDESTGELKRLSETGGLKNPTFLHLDAPKRRLYALAEAAAEDGSKISDAVSYTIDPEAGTLTQTSRAFAASGPTCHIQKSDDDRYLTLTSYHKGLVSLVELKADGTIGKLLDERQHIGKETDPSRRDIPHPHSSFYSPDKRFLYVPDLGIDRILCYRVNRDENKLELHGETLVRHGAGPRHLVFHPNGRFLFIINELDSSVTAFRYEAETGMLHEADRKSTLPEGYDGENHGCAEIAISADGRYLYGSNRGHDSIAVFAVDGDSGMLQPLEHVSTRGGHPRHFSIVPGGDYMIVANRDSDNNLVVFRVDKTTGRLTYAGQSVTLPKPVCVWASSF